MSQTAAAAADALPRGTLNWPVFILTAGFIVAFCGLALADIDTLSAAINASFAWSAKYFGFYWQLLLLATFVIAVILALTPAGSVVLGGMRQPEFGWFKWGAMIMCTLLAGGGVFWAAGEPMAHFLSPPPLFGVEGGGEQAVAPALAQSFMHWGFLAWAILGALTTIMLMHYHYDHGLPLAPRTLLYPVFGDRAIHGPLGWVIDASSIIAVVAGTVGPIGFLGLQVSYGLQDLFGIVDNFTTQAAVVAALVALYTVSAVTGIDKGIQILSRINVIMAAVLLMYILLLGPTGFIVKSWLAGFSTYVENFIPMALYRDKPDWLGWWTVFFWGWFLGYGPAMAIFITRISRGRSIRQIVLMLAIIAPVVTTIWFTIVGGSGIAFELANAGSVAKAFEGFNLPAALLAITNQLPAGFLISVLFLIMTYIFVATTGDSMTFCISRSLTSLEHPKAGLRVFWGVAMGLMAVILITIGSGGVTALQSFIVVTAVPVSLILLPSLWDAPRVAFKMRAEQRQQA